jgi:aminodeoxyfutalosine deaminase
MKVVAADYVLPVSSDVIERGALAICDGLIADVGSRDHLRRNFPDAEFEDFGSAAILPGFVNCHSHLEITSMRGALDKVEHDFAAWLLRLTELRAALTDEDLIDAATHGVREGLAAGVTCFGDIGRSGFAGLEALKTTGARGILFQETNFSPLDETADEQFATLIEKFETLRTRETTRVRVGLSPHSPYTVSPKLLTMIAGFARENEVKLSIHAAESSSENEFLTSGGGQFRKIFDDAGVAWSPPDSPSIEYLESLGVLAARPILGHCVTVSDRDIQLIAGSGAAIAHCPKSNAKFGHGVAPLERFLDAGVTVGLGSDSVASNNSCDLLEEGRFAALAARTLAGRRKFISPEEILRIATLGGAEALGLDSQIGSLEPGKQADIAVISLEAPAQQPIGDIHAALVFSSNGRDVALTMVAGEEVFRRPRLVQ